MEPEEETPEPLENGTRHKELMVQYEEHMKKFRPKMYRELKEDGALERVIYQDALTAAEQEKQIFDGIMKNEPPTQDNLERVQYRNMAKHTAWEMIQSQILLPSEKDVPRLY